MLYRAACQMSECVTFVGRNGVEGWLLNYFYLLTWLIGFLVLIKYKLKLPNNSCQK